jgi:hypothetical protein
MSQQNNDIWRRGASADIGSYGTFHATVITNPTPTLVTHVPIECIHVFARWTGAAKSVGAYDPKESVVVLGLIDDIADFATTHVAMESDDTSIKADIVAAFVTPIYNKCRHRSRYRR